MIILDNARIHRNREFQDLCTAAGVRVEYLPPYSPDFNPIEKSFAGLKAWMQKNRDLVAAFGGDFAGFLVHALETCPNHAVAYFEACHMDALR